MNGIARNRLEVLQVQQDLLPILNELAALEYDMLPAAGAEEVLRDVHCRLAAASATLGVIAERLDTIRERRSANVLPTVPGGDPMGEIERAETARRQRVFLAPQIANETRDERIP